jgi:16S rRNA (uracil1498-N3)-methyltransferase
VKAGEVFWFGDQNRRRYQVRLDDVALKRITGDIVDVCTAPESRAVHVTVVHAVIKAHRMSWMLQKTTELGVTQLVPLITDRTVVHAKASHYTQMVERWQRIALEAAQQAERWDVPTIHRPMELHAFLGESVQYDVKLLLWEKETDQRLSTVLRGGPRPTRISVLVGPEGGFTDQEVDAVKRCGYQAVTLGPRTLRSETSALAALSVIQSEFEYA